MHVNQRVTHGFSSKTLSDIRMCRQWFPSSSIFYRAGRVMSNTLCQSCRSLSYTAIKRNVMDSLSMQISSRCVWQIIEIGRVVNFWYICALCDGNSLHLTGRAVRLERSFHSLCRFRCVDYESITTWLCHTSSCLHHHMDVLIFSYTY